MQRAQIAAAVKPLVVGAVLGLVILGVGGRLAMAGIQVQTTGRSSWSIGGTTTVIFLGAVSGLAGAAIALVCRWINAKLAPGVMQLQHALFAVLLFFVTMRGLRGTPPLGRWYFYPLVVLYGVALQLVLGRALVRSD